MIEKELEIDGVVRTKSTYRFLEGIMEATKALYPNIKIDDKTMLSLFITEMCLIAEYFFDNPTAFVEHGFFRLYKPYGVGKFLTWQIVEDKFLMDPKGATNATLGEGSLVKEFKKQMVDFITDMCNISITEDTDAKDTIKKLKLKKRNDNAKQAKEEKEKEREHGN